MIVQILTQEFTFATNFLETLHPSSLNTFQEEILIEQKNFQILQGNQFLPITEDETIQTESKTSLGESVSLEFYSYTEKLNLEMKVERDIANNVNYGTTLAKFEEITSFIQGK